MNYRNYLLVMGLFLLMPFAALAQEYDTLCIKEDFDFYSENIVFKTYNLCTIDPNKDWNTFGDAISKIIDGYIDLYIATGDKAYLYKFVHQSMCIIENRNDINPEAFAKTPKWTETEMSTYADGYIIGTLSRFVYFIKVQSPELLNEPIYQFDELNPKNYGLNTCNCNYTKTSFLTFGEYAKWLEERTRETLDYFVYGGLWSDKLGMLQPAGTLIVNMQVGFARSLLFLGLSTENIEYLRMADTIASLHKKRVVFNDACSKQKFNNPVLRLNLEKNAYWWYHSGWSIAKRECLRSAFIKVPNYNGFTRYVEDVNHGAMVMLFPYDYYKYRPNPTLFNQTDMIRFRNTFVHLIYDNGKLNMGVDGSNGTTYNDERYKPAENDNIRNTSAIFFSNWSDFDDLSEPGSPKVYDIVMNEYIRLFYRKPILVDYYRGQKCYGHSQLVAQQWKHGKVNLSLYNRDMVYNQDFSVPGEIRIEAKYNRPKLNPSKAPLTFPKKFIDDGELDRFVIEPDVEVNLIAGESIIIKQGFYVKKGAKFKASIAEKENLFENIKIF